MKIVDDLRDRIFNMLPEKRDERFSNWVKTVTAINQNFDDGYMFEGEFLRDGTVSLVVKQTIFLACVTNGSRNHNASHYYVLTFDVESGLQLTDIYANNFKPGWALRIRDQVAALLPNDAVVLTDDEKLAALARELCDFFEELPLGRSKDVAISFYINEQGFSFFRDIEIERPRILEIVRKMYLISKGK